MLIVIIGAYPSAVALAQGEGVRILSFTGDMTAAPGQTVYYNMSISYEFKGAADVSPAIYDLLTLNYVSEEYFTVSGSGSGWTILNFTAPTTVGSYLYEGSVWYDTGNGWEDSGSDAYTQFTLVVRDPSEQVYAASTLAVYPPDSVNVGSFFQVTVEVEYEFSQSTEVSVAILDGNEITVLDSVSDTLSGKGTKSYVLDIEGPSGSGSYSMLASVIFNRDGEWLASDGSAMEFQVAMRRQFRVLEFVEENYEIMILAGVMIILLNVVKLLMRRKKPQPKVQPPPKQPPKRQPPKKQTPPKTKPIHKYDTVWILNTVRTSKEKVSLAELSRKYGISRRELKQSIDDAVKQGTIKGSYTLNGEYFMTDEVIKQAIIAKVDEKKGS